MTEDVFSFDEKEHKYTLNGVEIVSITQALGATGWINEEFYTEAGRIRGVAVHRACWFLAENDLNWATVKPEYLGYVKGFEKFLEESKFRTEWCERPLYSKVYNFAGTPDMFGRMNERSAVIDIKTGEVGIHASLQTAGQKVLVQERGCGEVEDRFALRLFDDGTYKLYPFKNFGDTNMFLSAVAMVNHRKNNGIHWRQK